MYQSITSVTLKGSSSSLFNNLDILPQKKNSAGSGSTRNCSYLSVSRHSVNIVQQNNASLTHRQVCVKEGTSSSTATILEAKWCHLSNQVILVLAHTKGVQVDVASADDEGSLSLWKFSDSKLKFVGNVTGSRYPCTSLCLLPNGLLAAGFYTGQIRIVDTATCDILAEIAAHAAALNSIDAASLPDKNNCCTIVSGGEDTFVRVWKISRTPQLKIRQDWYTSVRDLLICGVKFHDTDTMFGVTGYDSNEVFLYMRTS